MSRPAAMSPDAAMATLVAHGFYANSQAFFAMLPNDLNDSAKQVFERRGELAAAATSLALSIELYLKAIAIRSKGTPSRIHDLGRLYQALPTEVRAHIQESYAHECRAMPSDRPASVELFVTTTPYPPTEAEIRELSRRFVSTDSVVSLLTNEKDAFQNWRYVYEADMPSGVTMIKFEHIRLGIVAKILKGILERECA